MKAMKTWVTIVQWLYQITIVLIGLLFLGFVFVFIQDIVNFVKGYTAFSGDEYFWMSIALLILAGLAVVFFGLSRLGAKQIESEAKAQELEKEVQRLTVVVADLIMEKDIEG